MLVYGGVKVFQGQFYTDDYWKDTELGQLNGMQLTWAFYSYSPWYETALGIVEVGLGLLILFRRTTMLGVLLFLPVMANLVLLNFVFDIGAFATAIPLLLAGLYLCLADFKKLKQTFWDAPDELPQRAGFKSAMPKVMCCLIGCALAAVIIYNNKFRYPQDPKLRGAWTMLNPQTGVDKIYFEKGRQCVIRDQDRQLHFTNYVAGAQLLTIEKNESKFDLTDASYEFRGDTLVFKSNGEEHVLLRR